MGTLMTVYEDYAMSKFATQADRATAMAREIADLRDANKQWFAFAMKVGGHVQCLASSFPDANEHILAKLAHKEQSNGHR